MAEAARRTGETVEDGKETEMRRRAEVLAEERRKAREEAIAWTQAAMLEDEEERERRPRKKARSENVSEDEGVAGVSSRNNPPNPQRPLEAIVLLASLHAFPRPGIIRCHMHIHSADTALVQCHS